MHHVICKYGGFIWPDAFDGEGAYEALSSLRSCWQLMGAGGGRVVFSIITAIVNLPMLL